jgi:hypothetical protein
MPETTATPLDQSLDVNKIIKDFEDLLVNPGMPRGRGPLWYAWHYLQVYSVWGLWLPHTQEALKLKLGINDPLAYSFFQTMMEGYRDIHDASKEFLEADFPAVVELGNDLTTFASEASSRGGAIFSAVSDLLDKDDTAAALELIEDLQSTSANNAGKAGEVTEKLNAYKVRLTEADNTVKQAQEKVNNDDKTSKATIDKLQSHDPNVHDSIDAIQKLITAKQQEYKRNVVIAATTPTYAWVFPIGLISGAVVAGVYGKRAVQALRDIDQWQAELQKKSTELSTAWTAHTVQQNAADGLNSAKQHTDLAILHTTVVQNAWNDMAKQIGIIKTKLDGMTREQDQGKVLSAKAVIRVYMRNAMQAWERILPALSDLTANPYITVKNEEMSLAEFGKEVEKEIAKAA